MKRIVFPAVLFILMGVVSIAPGEGLPAGLHPGPVPGPAQEGYSTKTTDDYLETILSRDTKPLGFREDVVLRNLLRQPAAMWAFRAGVRHALD